MDIIWITAGLGGFALLLGAIGLLARLQTED
jgi:hypothetical protein